MIDKETTEVKHTVEADRRGNIFSLLITETGKKIKIANTEE